MDSRVDALTNQVLSRYIAYRHSVDTAYLRRKAVLELGSGTGLVGIVAGMLDPDTRIWVTDQA
jgi:predicted nicotinamide N-methyase